MLDCHILLRVYVYNEVYDLCSISNSWLIKLDRLLCPFLFFYDYDGADKKYKAAD